MINLNQKQAEKLAGLFMDLAKAMILAGFTLPLIWDISSLILLKYFIGSTICVYLSLRLLKKME